MSFDRLSGLSILVFGLLFYFVVIPYGTEVVEYGWVRPQTIPNVMALIIAIAGSFLIIRPGLDQPIDFRSALMAAAYFSLIVLALFVIANFGFVYTAPFLALAIMLLTGERRFIWLVTGIAVVPFIIWFVVSVLLNRLLP